jgi:hypothetical protein
MPVPVSMYAVFGVSRSIPSVPSPAELVGAELDEQLDPELASLPDPPRQQRTLTLVILALAAVAAFAMVVALRADVVYALAGTTPANLGDLHTAPSNILDSHDNRFIRAEAMLGAAGGIRYERLLSEDTFRTVPVAGRRDIWVEVRVPAGQENGRWEPPRTFTGRLVHFDGAGPRHRGLASAIDRVTQERLPRGAWLLVDGEDPAHARRTALLAALFLGFAAWHIAALVKMIRRVS